MLGGLITKSTAELKRRVPWLSDVPVLGWLFRYDGVQKQRTELLIFLTPRVISSPLDMQRVKQVETARMDWCCADVHEIHGPGLCGRRDCPFCEANIPVVYPDLDPRGILPEDAGRGPPSLIPPSPAPANPWPTPADPGGNASSRQTPVPIAGAPRTQAAPDRGTSRLSPWTPEGGPPPQPAAPASRPLEGVAAASHTWPLDAQATPARLPPLRHGATELPYEGPQTEPETNPETETETRVNPWR